MKKAARSFFAMMLISLAAGACDDGLSTEDASDRCTEERAASPSAWNDGVFDRCVACFEECGEFCSVVDTVSPPEFSCAEF